VNNYWSLLIWVAVLGGILGFLWSKGYIARMRDYVAETQQELKKCTWPSIEELKGSVVVVVITITLLGVFTVGVDWILSKLIGLILA
jgi:preprotein translocase subunit SecE